MRSVAPGKIIISGEHSVVYGSPALAVAVDIHAYAKVERLEEPSIHLHLDNYGQRTSLPLREMAQVRLTIDNAYQRYLLGHCSVEKVLTHASELYLYAMASLYHRYSLPFEHGLNISLKSTIPVRSGMGSSAATIAAILVAVAGYFDLHLDKESLFQLTRHTERLQHGCNSTIDPMITVHGGLVRVENSQLTNSSELPALNWYLVNTGEPEVSTGQCVAEVRRRFGGSAIWNEFSAIIKGVEQAFLRRDTRALRECVKRNHQLLVDIGVVPDTVQRFIRDLISRYGAAGKISGAGAVHGEKAGFVLVQCDEPMETLCREYGFSVARLQSDPLGARLCY
ncbi:MAG: mevalonate kinase [Endozoicomonadaceae bacterium]|nr:mevalonate kinase [Endozoicomonadaceae bacterium]